MKRYCPYCDTPYKGTAPDGVSFFDKHVAQCPAREPINPRSLPIQEHLTVCLTCGGDSFMQSAQYKHNRLKPLWEFVCLSCGQIHTALASLDTIAEDVPFNIQGPEKRNLPPWRKR